MKNSKLIQLLKTFSEEEINEFEKFLMSPLSKSRNYAVNFFRELKRQYPEFNDEKIDRKKIFLRLNKNKEYNDSTVRSIVSSLISDAEHYLSYSNFRSNKAITDYHLLAELRERELHNYFDLKAKPVIKHLKNDRQFDYNDILYDYLISHEIVNHNSNEGITRELIEMVNIMNDKLLLFFLANSSLVLHYSYILKTFFPFETNNYLEKNYFLNMNYEGFVDSLGNDNSQEAKYIDLSYCLHNLLTADNSHESFDSAKEIWLRSSDFLSVQSRKAVFDILGNFCLLQNRKKNNKYTREFFELSKVMLRDNLFLTDINLMHINTFRQITLHCFILNEIDWCEEFVKKYSKYLKEDERQMLVDLTMAQIAFRKKDFQIALFHLACLNEIKSEFKLEIKEMYIKVYYEIGYTEELYYAFDSFRHYLKNAPFLPDYIHSAKNFLRYVSAILNHKIKNDSDIHILRKELSKELHVHFKDWLLEKADELCE